MVATKLTGNPISYFAKFSKCLACHRDLNKYMYTVHCTVLRKHFWCIRLWNKTGFIILTDRILNWKGHNLYSWALVR